MYVLNLRRPRALAALAIAVAAFVLFGLGRVERPWQVSWTEMAVVGWDVLDAADAAAEGGGQSVPPYAVDGEGTIYLAAPAGRTIVALAASGETDRIELGGVRLSQLTDLDVAGSEFVLLDGQAGRLLRLVRQSGGSRAWVPGEPVDLDWQKPDKYDVYAALGLWAEREGPVILREVWLEMTRHRFQLREISASGATLSLLVGVDLTDSGQLAVDRDAVVQAPALDATRGRSGDIVVIVSGETPGIRFVERYAADGSLRTRTRLDLGDVAVRNVQVIGESGRGAWILAVNRGHPSAGLLLLTPRGRLRHVDAGSLGDGLDAVRFRVGHDGRVYAAWADAEGVHFLRGSVERHIRFRRRWGP